MGRHAHPGDGGRVNLLATSGGGPYVTLSTHLDTVPPLHPAAPRRDTVCTVAARATRRGSPRRCCARPSGCARAAPRWRCYSSSARRRRTTARTRPNDWARTNAFPSIALVNGEPTESTLALGTKGAMRVIVRTTGEAAHSAYPHLGRSATRALVQLLAELDTVVAAERSSCSARRRSTSEVWLVASRTTSWRRVPKLG